jgi:transmembrane sensor
MNGVLDSMGSEVPAAQAADAWFARLMAPDCTDAEHRAFEDWRANAPANARAYAATASVWERLEGLEEDGVIGPHAAAALGREPAPMAEWLAAVQPRRAKTPSRSRPRWQMPAALVAGVLACAIGLRFVLPMLSDVDPLRYRTIGQAETVTLADGSRVRMDLSTRIEVRMRRHARDVALLQGRAIFDVAHDTARPFIVDTGHGSVTAVGTQFQVDRDSDGIVVTLVEGVVSVAGRNDDGGTTAIRLTPGEQARYSPQQQQWTRRDVDTVAVTSWSHGFHVFSATPLADAVREINRYSPTKLRLHDASLDSLVLSGNFKTGDADRIAGALPAVLPVKVEKVAGDIVVSRR